MQLLGRIRSSRSGRGQLLQDMKKVVYKLDITDITAKQKAMKAVSTLQGVDFIAIDMDTKTLTVIGLVDPVDVVGKLRKNWPTDIISVGPAKEPEQPKEAPKEEAKKEEAKEAKEEPKKEGKGEEGKEGEAKKEEGKKEEDEKKKEVPPEEVIKGYNYRVYNYPPPNYVSAPHYYAHSMEENPNACVIS